MAWLSSGFSAEYLFILWALDLSSASPSSLSSCRGTYSDILSFTFLGTTGTFARIGIFSVSKELVLVCFLNRLPVSSLVAFSLVLCGGFGFLV